MKRLNFLIPIIFAITLIHGCGSSDVSDAVKVFSKYSKAMRGDNLQEAATCWSQGDYPKLTKEGKENFKKVKTSILKAEKKDSYVRLLVRFEEDTSSYEKWQYLIRENGRMVMAHRVKALTMDWPIVKSPHFIVHSRDTTKVGEIVGRLEECYQKITEVYGIEAEGKIEYFLFGSKKEYSELLGEKPYAEITRGRSIISFKFAFEHKGYNPSHEMTHAIFYTLGIAIPFLCEGIAAYPRFYIYRLDWKGHPLKYWLDEYINTGKYVPIPDLIAWSKFYKVPSQIGFMEAASFVAYLIEKRGFEKFRELYAHSSSEREFKETLKELYGQNIYQMEEEWEKLITGQQVKGRSSTSWLLQGNSLPFPPNPLRLQWSLLTRCEILGLKQLMGGKGINLEKKPLGK